LPVATPAPSTRPAAPAPGKTAKPDFAGEDEFP
jgi:hypothetical protein